MEGAPNPASNPNEKKSQKLRKVGTITAAVVGGAIAAASPITKANPGTMPSLPEKLVVRPEDADDTALKNEIEAKRAKFEIGKDGEIKRIVG